MINTLSNCFKNHMPVMLKGAPGIGKTDVIKQAAKKAGMKCIISHPVVSDPTDYKGLPTTVNGLAEFLPYGDLRQLMETDEPTVFFLDDLGQAPAVVQAACMQLLLGGQINGKAISRSVTFAAATNRREDRAGVTGILEPVKSRFYTILSLDVDKDDWVKWAMEHSMPSSLIGFVHFRPGLLVPGTPSQDIVNSPCPRTFAHAGRLIDIGEDSIEVLAGAVGEGAATELVSFLRICKSLPNIDNLIKNPDKAIIPDDVATKYAIVSALVDRATKDNVGNIFKYGSRLPKEFDVCLGCSISNKDPEIFGTKAGIEWVRRHKDVIITNI